MVHVNNEQPLLADLFDVPSSSDTGLLCTNLRMTDGKRPVFIDRIEGTFFFPYHVIRFIELPVGAVAAHVAETGRPAPAAREWAGAALDADASSVLPVPAAAPDGLGELDLDVEIDEEFLRRIR